MNGILYLVVLVLLVLLSAFFSASETAMMSLNRYRLRNLAQKNYLPAERAMQLLQQPNRLLGAILVGNSFAIIVASAIATLLTIQWFGEPGVIVAAAIMVSVILVIGAVLPKTLAALYPERVAFLAMMVLSAWVKIVYPIVWIINTISNGFLRLLGIPIKKQDTEHLVHEEMRTIISEAMGKLGTGQESMLLGALDLSGMTVDDIKVPRNEIIGINLNEDWDKIVLQLQSSRHTRLPIYRESIDHVLGIIHMRRVVNMLAKSEFSIKTLLDAAEDVYFIPEGTPLNIQLLNFRQEKRRIGLVVDEYGDIQGLLTIADILEEIVKEFTTSLTGQYQAIQLQKDGSYLVDGSISLRELNRHLAIHLPMTGPKTLSGLIIEYLEIIPDAAIALRIENCIMEVLRMEGKMIKLVRLWIPERKK